MAQFKEPGQDHNSRMELDLGILLKASECRLIQDWSQGDLVFSWSQEITTDSKTCV